jgi:hypothetical protein
MGIVKELTGQQKITEKPRQQRKASNSSKPAPSSPGRGEAEDTIIR